VVTAATAMVAAAKAIGNFLMGFTSISGLRALNASSLEMFQRQFLILMP
jgi:hypothetical protein